MSSPRVRVLPAYRATTSPSVALVVVGAPACGVLPSFACWQPTAMSAAASASPALVQAPCRVAPVVRIGAQPYPTVPGQSILCAGDGRLDARPVTLHGYM